jgi:UDP-N-acetylglucosamine 2-epimerase (non-hydrolysing)/GDP/UDP-N,N'-diacetylbacillosamine 2-epimerase (hydrolysing)
VDESIRHAVTKLATYHFPATQLYADNIAQLGEDPERIFLSGAPGLDRLLETDEITREALLADVAMDPALPTALVALHPVTTEDAASAGAMAEAVVKALVERGLQALFTGANADAHGQLINDYFQDVADHYPDRFRFRMHLGGFLFINAMRRLDIMVGNSSSGLIEAPSCKIPVVNIGDRQAGRVAAENVLHARPTPAAISEAIRQALSPQFRKVAREALNPYRPVNEVTAGEFIKEVLKRVSLDPGVLKKDFVTLER